MKYEVVVGNVGTVLSISDPRPGLSARAKAELVYAQYVRKSQNGEGRAAGESVSLLADGEPIMEHIGSLDSGG